MVDRRQALVERLPGALPEGLADLGDLRLQLDSANVLVGRLDLFAVRKFFDRLAGHVQRLGLVARRHEALDQRHHVLGRGVPQNLPLQIVQLATLRAVEKTHEFLRAFGVYLTPPESVN